MLSAASSNSGRLSISSPARFVSIVVASSAMGPILLTSASMTLCSRSMTTGTSRSSIPGRVSSATSTSVPTASATMGPASSTISSSPSNSSSTVPTRISPIAAMSSVCNPSLSSSFMPFSASVKVEFILRPSGSSCPSTVRFRPLSAVAASVYFTAFMAAMAPAVSVALVAMLAIMGSIPSPRSSY